MKVISKDECEYVSIDSFPYRGRLLPVKGVSLGWLSQQGDDGHGSPEYGLRFFKVDPGGEIPIHNHFYVQTMYILEGEFECRQFDPETDKLIGTFTCRAGEAVFVPSLEPHGMRNLSETKSASFLCCICNVYE